MSAAKGFPKIIKAIGPLLLLISLWGFSLCHAVESEQPVVAADNSATKKEAEESIEQFTLWLDDIERLKRLAKARISYLLTQEKESRLAIDSAQTEKQRSVHRASLAKWQQLRADLENQIDSLEQSEKSIRDQLSMLKEHLKKEPAEE